MVILPSHFTLKRLVFRITSFLFLSAILMIDYCSINHWSQLLFWFFYQIINYERKK